MDFAEQQFVKRLKAGNEDAFYELVDLYSELLLRVALRHTSKRVDAEDLVQETFEAAFTGINKFESRSTLKSWLVSILYRRAARHHRSRKSEKRDESSQQNPTTPPMSQNRQRACRSMRRR